MKIDQGRKHLEFLELLRDKKVILFGAGPTCDELLSKIPLECAFIVDNDPDFWGRKFRGLEIRNPDQLKEENRESIAVIIACSDVLSVVSQLEKMDLRLGKEIHVSPFLEFIPPGQETRYPSLLVTCPTENGGLLKVDPNTLEIRKVYSGNCRGIVRSQEFYYVVEEHEGILVLNEQYELVDLIKTKESHNLHGIAIDEENGLIYVNETKFDRLGIYDVKTRTRVDEIVLRKGEPDTFDQHHINDVNFYDDKLFVSMFSLNGVWKHGVWNDGGIAIVDKKNRCIEKVVLSGLHQPHSVYIEENIVYHCNSRECNVLMGDKTLCQFTGYTRGLTKWNEYFFVGQSRARRLSAFTDRFTNISKDTGIHIWNSADKTSTFIKIPAEQIFEILVLGQ